MFEPKPQITLQKAGKKFNLNLARKESALFRCLNFFSSKDRNKDEFWALRNITLNPRKGSIVGLIGKNGSGKSTLLKMIAGIYQPDEGMIKTEGEIVYLTGFGQGIMPKLTMKENIYLIGTLLGLNKKEIDEKYEEIVEFSELKNYENSKIYQFSSGMVSRLSFSTTILCLKRKNPEILLIDEALDAGADLSFKNKALEKIEELIKGGATVIMASHDLATIEKYCDMVLWLEKGEVVKKSLPAEVIPEYIKESQKNY